MNHDSPNYASLFNLLLFPSCFFLWLAALVDQGPPHCWAFPVTLWRATLVRNPLDEWWSHVIETSTWKHSQETDIHVASGIRTHNPSKRVAADPRLRLRGHWDRQLPSIFLSTLLSNTVSLCASLNVRPNFTPIQNRGKSYNNANFNLEAFR